MEKMKGQADKSWWRNYGCERVKQCGLIANGRGQVYQDFSCVRSAWNYDTYHFRQVDNWYVAEVRDVAERTSTFEGE